MKVIYLKMGNVQSLSVETGFLSNILSYLDNFFATTNDFDPTFLQNYHKDFYAIVGVSKWAKTQIILYLTKLRKINICLFDYTKEEIFIGLVLKKEINIPENIGNKYSSLKHYLISCFKGTEILKQIEHSCFYDKTTHPKFYDIPFNSFCVKICFMNGEIADWNKTIYRGYMCFLFLNFLRCDRKNKFLNFYEIFITLYHQEEIKCIKIFHVIKCKKTIEDTKAKHARLNKIHELLKQATLFKM